MGANRFLVLKSKELIKAAVLLCIGIALILTLLHTALGGRGKKNQAYLPGTYASDIVLENGKMSVEVKVSKNKIKSVKMNEKSENVPVFYPLFESSTKELAKEIVKNQGVDFSYSGDYPQTNKMIMQAVQKSLDKAKNGNRQ